MTLYCTMTLCHVSLYKIVVILSLLAGCPIPPPMFSGPPTVQPGVVIVSWTAAGSSDPLVTGVRYALYSQCGAETTFQLIDDDIQGLTFNITTLPVPNQCMLRVVVYSDHCLLDVDGPHGNTTDYFTTGKLVQTMHTTFDQNLHPCVLSLHYASSSNSKLMHCTAFSLSS